MLREATPPGRMIARLLVPVLLAVALVAATGLDGLDRVRASRTVSGYAETTALPVVDAAAALAVELAATTTGGDLAAARTATDTAVAAAVEAARTLDDTRQDAASSAVAAQAQSLPVSLAALRTRVDENAGTLAEADVTLSYQRLATGAAGWPLDLVRTTDVGQATAAQLLSLVQGTDDLVSATAASGTVDSTARGALVTVAEESGSAASGEVDRQAGLAAATVVALLLAAACLWLARERRGAGASVPEEGHRPTEERPAAAPERPVAAGPAPARPVQPRPAPLRSAGTAVVPAHECGSAAALAAARRDLALLNRQLVALDALEQTEEDPSVLAELFELDNLTVRLRRNAESLLVLAGSEHGRRARDLTPVADVLRAAASQIEQYDRVQISLVHDPYLHASHVVPVAHLLAELMENATAFAEPITPVEITGACDAEQMTIEVRDAGVGMTPADLAAANAQLAAAEDVSDGRMGLRVVARLAARLGIEVRLRPGPDGTGTVAAVRLPRGLFAEPEAPQDVAPAAVAGPVAGPPTAAVGPSAPVDVPPQLTAAQLAMPLPQVGGMEAAFEPVQPAASASDVPLPRRLPTPAPDPAAPAPAWQPVVPVQQTVPPTFDAVLGAGRPTAEPVPDASEAASGRGGRRLLSRRARRAEQAASASVAPVAGTVGPDGTVGGVGPDSLVGPDGLVDGAGAFGAFGAGVPATVQPMPGTPVPPVGGTVPAAPSAPAPGAAAEPGPATFLPAEPAGRVPERPGSVPEQGGPVSVAGLAPTSTLTSTQTFAPIPTSTPTQVFTPTQTFAPVSTSAAETTFTPAAAGAPDPTGRAADPAGAVPAPPAFAPAETGFTPAETGFTPAEPGFAPAETGFAPAEPGFAPAGAGWTGGGVDTAAGIRAAAQKAAMAELSGLTAYRPEAAAAGSALPPRSPAPVAPPVDGPAAQPVDRDADELRHRFSAFRSGASRGRGERSSTLLGP